MNNWGIRQEKITDYKSICYIAKRLEPTYDEYGNMFTEYDTPQKYYMNIQPVTNTSNATVFGELTHRVKCSIVPKEIYEDKFKEFDLAYLDGATPTNESYNGEKANYRIYSIQPQNAILKIYFIKIVKGEEINEII